jgi:hypothetical protein
MQNGRGERRGAWYDLATKLQVPPHAQMINVMVRVTASQLCPTSESTGHPPHSAREPHVRLALLKGNSPPATLQRESVF